MEEQLANITEQDLMREFMGLVVESRTIHPNEITTKNFSEQMNLTMPCASHLLENLRQQKILKIRKVQLDSHVVNAYSPYSGTWKDVIGMIKLKE